MISNVATVKISKIVFWLGLALFLLVLFQIESILIGSTKLSYTWGSVFCSVLVCAPVLRDRITLSVYKSFLLLSLLMLISLEILYNPKNSIFPLATPIIIFLIGIYTLQELGAGVVIGLLRRDYRNALPIDSIDASDIRNIASIFFDLVRKDR